jgi:hypothetical protein
MDLTIAWVAFPLLLLALCVGCGLLVERLARIELPGALVPLVGLATIIVVAQFLTVLDATAEFATPVVAILAGLGFLVNLPRGRAIAWWAVGTAVAVFALHAAPIVLSGQATFAGYIELDDTATWMAFTDQVMSHGRDLSGLAPSTYEATLSVNIGQGYPVGALLPLGVGRALVWTDVAWLIQPYMAVLAALGSLALWELAGAVIRVAWVRAVAAFLAAQSALLVGYYLWGGIKEVAGAALVATVACLAGAAIRDRLDPRTLVPLAIVCAALIGVLSGGGAIWLAPILAAVLVAGAWSLGAVPALARAAAFVGGTAILCLPVLVSGGLLPPTSSPLTSETASGNLLGSLDPLQVFGVWASGDFRLQPHDAVATYVLIGVVAAAALAGIYAAWRARGWPLLLYLGGVLIGGGVIYLVGSPWIEGKALAMASPAFVLLAGVGAGALFASRPWIVGAIAFAAISVGVLWSNALAYHDVNLAPRDQLAELEAIGHRIAGQGPTLMTEYQPYGVRHFLRDADPEGASELRRRTVPLLNGNSVPKGETADTDRFELGGLMVYRTLVLRRSPSQSRPPAPYRLIWRGTYYEVWQRPPDSQGTVLAHLGLGTVTDPAGVPTCAAVRRLARQAGRGGTLGAVRRDPVEVIPVSRTEHPAAWTMGPGGSTLSPVTPGDLNATVDVPRAGDYDVWLRGSVRPQVDLLVDGDPAGEVRDQLNNSGEYVELGTAHLEAGRHEITVRFHGSDLHPGSAGPAAAIGPLVLSDQTSADTHVSFVPASQADRLCGRRWDWIEVLTGATTG